MSSRGTREAGRSVKGEYGERSCGLGNARYSNRKANSVTRNCRTGFKRHFAQSNWIMVRNGSLPRADGCSHNSWGRRHSVNRSLHNWCITVISTETARFSNSNSNLITMPIVAILISILSVRRPFPQIADWNSYVILVGVLLATIIVFLLAISIYVLSPITEYLVGLTGLRTICTVRSDLSMPHITVC